MKNLTEQLANYACYHRDPRNIATHFFGIPMIVLASIILLARPSWMLGADFSISPGLILALMILIYYFRLDRPLALLMSGIFALCFAFAIPLASGPTGPWLSWGLGLFGLGWLLQTIGHIWEGRKPAFVDDLVGLLIGPLFVCCELLFLLGLRADLAAAIDQISGPKRTGKTRL